MKKLITGRIRKEIDAFNLLSNDGKRLFLVNFIYSFAYPFIIIFGSAFIMRITGGNNKLTIIYNWGFFAGLIMGCLITGISLKNNVNIKRLYTIGMNLTVIPLSLLMFLVTKGGYYVVIYGLLIGTGNGIYWSCRNFLTYLVTSEENRNYYLGLQLFVVVLFNAIIPLLFGTIILGSSPSPVYKIAAYRYSSLFVVFISLVSGFIIMKSNFKSPKVHRFNYLKYGSPWNLQRFLTFSFGMVQSGFMVLMILLILNIAGDETVLGKIEFWAAILSAMVTYFIGRKSKPKHRGKIMYFGAISILIGGILLSFLLGNNNILLGILTFSFLGVILMKVSQVISEPIISTAYASTMQANIEKSSVIENRDSFSYIMDHEYFLNFGRIFGGMVFLLLTNYMGDTGALKYTFILFGIIQIVAGFLVTKFNKTLSPGKRKEEIDLA